MQNSAAVYFSTPFRFHSGLAWSLGNCTTAEEKGKQADGAAFLPEPGTDGLKQGHVMQDITFHSIARLSSSLRDYHDAC